MWDINTIRGLEIKQLRETIEDMPQGDERKKLEQELLRLALTSAK